TWAPGMRTRSALVRRRAASSTTRCRRVPTAPISSRRAGEAFIDATQPQFIPLQRGADSLAGDPLAALRVHARDHAHVAVRLRVLADRHAGGRLEALGGGGCNRANLATGGCAVTAALLDRVPRACPG